MCAQARWGPGIHFYQRDHWVNKGWKQQHLLGVFLDFCLMSYKYLRWWQQRSYLWAAGTALGVEAALRVSRKQLPHLYGRKKKLHHSERRKTPSW